jgi:SAM-dependent methyltransferase
MRGDNMKSELEFDKKYYLNHLDFKDWVRYYEVLKGIYKYECQHILEIGSGSGILTDLLKPNVLSFCLMDINANLKPDLVGDVRNFYPGLFKNFDCVIACEVLEHIQLMEVRAVIRHFYQYLKCGGKVFITVPHRNPFVSFISVLNTWYPKTIVIPRLRNLKHKKPVDPYHKWEIGYGASRKQCESIFKECGFNIIEHKNIPYHDYLVLEK